MTHINAMTYVVHELSILNTRGLKCSRCWNQEAIFCLYVRDAGVDNVRHDDAKLCVLCCAMVVVGVVAEMAGAEHIRRQNA